MLVVKVPLVIGVSVALVVDLSPVVFELVVLAGTLLIELPFLVALLLTRELAL